MADQPVGRFQSMVMWPDRRFGRHLAPVDLLVYPLPVQKL